MLAMSERFQSFRQQSERRKANESRKREGFWVTTCPSQLSLPLPLIGELRWRCCCLFVYDFQVLACAVFTHFAHTSHRSSPFPSSKMPSANSCATLMKLGDLQVSNRAVSPIQSTWQITAPQQQQQWASLAVYPACSPGMIPSTKTYLFCLAVVCAGPRWRTATPAVGSGPRPPAARGTPRELCRGVQGLACSSRHRHQQRQCTGRAGVRPQ